jgi:phosphatidate cytidylyltransferase
LNSYLIFALIKHKQIILFLQPPQGIMAINIQKLGTRAVTALVFVLVLLACLLWNYYSFTVFFFIISMWALLEFFQVAEKLGAFPDRVVGFTAGVFTYAAFISPSIFSGASYNPLFPFIIVVPGLILGSALFDLKPGAFTGALFTLGGIIYAVLPFGLLHELVIGPDSNFSTDFSPFTLLGVILLIWSNDTFAYLGGSLLGKHIMIGRISPGKTWEGTLSGIICTIGISFILRNYLAPDNSMFWLAAGIMVPVFATIGDLLQSVLKRQAGIKDTGRIMPGHGGILDRFDSLIFVTPFVVVLVKLIA